MIDAAQTGTVTSNNIVCAWPTPIENNQGGILTFKTLVGGSSYTNGSYTNVPLTGGSGFSGRANVTVSGGAVAAVTTYYGENFSGRVLGRTTPLTIPSPLMLPISVAPARASQSRPRLSQLIPSRATTPRPQNCNASGWTGTQPTLTAPDRTVPTYDLAHGGPGTFGETSCSKRLTITSSSWNPVYTRAPAVNTYVRARVRPMMIWLLANLSFSSRCSSNSPM